LATSLLAGSVLLSPDEGLPARIFISILFIGIVGEGRLCGSQWTAQSSHPGQSLCSWIEPDVDCRLAVKLPMQRSA